MLIHNCNEPIIMMSRKQVYEFVHHNVFKALGRLLCQFEVDPYPTRLSRARTPFGLHPFNAECGYLDAKALLPFSQQRRNSIFEMLAIPTHQYLSPGFNTRARSHMEFDSRTIPNNYLGGPINSVDAESIPLTGEVVALPTDHLPF
jgi:hypothetical protein